MKTTAIPLAMLVVVGAFAFAQETTIKVPQGSGVFPTVGQVNCIEELGSGRLCAATYECSGESGRLWGNLANHDGRRAIGEDSPVARGRDCTITIDGGAAVRWLTGYSPGGRNGELVGLTTSAEALRPVQSVQWQTGEGGSLLDYVLELHHTTLRELVEQECGDVAYRMSNDCFAGYVGRAVRAMNLPDDSLGRCVVDATEAAYRDEGTGGALSARVMQRLNDWLWTLPDSLTGWEVERYAECLPLMREKAAAHGLEYIEWGSYPGALQLSFPP